MIRLFSEIDLPQLLMIEELTQLSPWTEDIFKQCFKLGSLCWVLEHEDQVVGFVIAIQQVGECHILDIGVHPVYQRRGFGQQLLIYVLKKAKAKGAGIAYLEVRRSNKSAIALYDKLDFVEIGDRKAYYATKNGREDAIIYAKDLRLDESL